MADIRTKYVFISNLPFDQTEELMADIFKTVGPLRHLRILFDNHGKHRGMGYVEYVDPETAASAIRNLQGVEIEGRALRLEYGVLEGGVIRPLSRSAAGRRDHSSRQPHRPHDASAARDRARPQSVLRPGASAEAQAKKIESLSPLQLVELMIQLKRMINTNVEEVYNLTSANPTLSFTLLKAMIMMNVADPTALHELITADELPLDQSAQTGPKLTPELSSILSKPNSAEIIQSIMLMTDQQVRALPSAENQSLFFKIRSQVQRLLSDAGIS